MGLEGFGISAVEYTKVHAALCRRHLTPRVASGWHALEHQSGQELVDTW